MKYTSLFLLALLLLPLLSFDSKSLVGKPVPLLPNNQTTDGKTIDASYFKGHVTVVNFMFIGCMPCMNEIGMFNQLKKEYSADPRVQVLCIARQMKDQMRQFNSEEVSIFSQVRKAFHAPVMEYAILPACPDGESKMVKNGDEISIKSECDAIAATYGVESYPTLFFVDADGIIRKVTHGGPPTRNDTAFYNNLKKEVDMLLVE